MILKSVCWKGAARNTTGLLAVFLSSLCHHEDIFGSSKTAGARWTYLWYSPDQALEQAPEVKDNIEVQSMPQNPIFWPRNETRRSCSHFGVKLSLATGLAQTNLGNVTRPEMPKYLGSLGLSSDSRRWRARSIRTTSTISTPTLSHSLARYYLF